MAQSPFQSLNVGNVVTTAFQLYKNRFKSYFLLALKVYFWLLVPIYGWAKFCTISALISRLVYCKLVNQPETITGGTRYVNSKLWQFLLASVLLGFIVLGVWIVLAIAFIIVFVIVGVVFSGLFPIFQVSSVTTTAIASAMFTAICIFGLISILIRFFVLELPLAVEDNINVNSSFRRSWELTKGLARHILSIYFVAFLITFPLLALLESVYSLIFRFPFGNFVIAYPLPALIGLAEILRRMFQFLFGGVIDQNKIFSLLLDILQLCLGIVLGAVQLPLWQATKAVVYYDLRSRKEGLGLKLRDRNI